MREDAWRDSYDAWKTTPPEPEGYCYRCGSPVDAIDEDGWAWTCEDCGYVLEPEPEYDPADAYDLDDPKRMML